jgi:predicted alpha/beta superfamily hydrolase
MDTTADIGPARVARGDAEPGAQLTGDFEILHDFRSHALGNARRVSIYLPPGYHTSDARYPVLYLQDGQNLFDPARAFVPGQDWRLDETAQALIEAGLIAPLVMVGIDHAGPDRIDEYTPTRDARRGQGGRLAAYRHMLIDELKPWVDRYLRTRSDAASTGLGGSSLGGLATLEIGLSRPDVFGRLAIMSPSLWWDKRRALAEARALDARLPVHVWLDAGTDEGPGALHHARMLKNILLAKGWRLNRDLHYREVKGGRHSEGDWASRAGDMLRTLFPPGLDAHPR